MASAETGPLTGPQLSQSNSNVPNDDATPRGPSLLDLSAELRNIIYEEVLIDHRHLIEVNATNCTQPALLMVNRQIRSEASSIYVERNAFELHIDELKLPNTAHWLIANASETEIYFLYYDFANLGNLKEWLRKWYENPALPTIETNPRFASHHEMDHKRDFVTCEEAFRIVAILKDAGMSWRVIEKVLDSLFSAVEEWSFDPAFDEYEE